MVRAQAKFIRMSPRKLRRVINVIRGKDTHEAQAVLKFMPYAAARVVEKVLKSAVSNAKENHSLNPDELRITKAYIDQSTTLKRWRAMSRGRGYPIMKRTSHVTIEVDADTTLANRKVSRKPGQKTQKVQTHKHDQHAHEHEHGPGCDHDHEHSEESKADVKKEGKTSKKKLNSPKSSTKETKEVKGKTKEKETKEKKKKGKEE